MCESWRDVESRRRTHAQRRRAENQCHGLHKCIKVTCPRTEGGLRRGPQGRGGWDDRRRHAGAANTSSIRPRSIRRMRRSFRSFVSLSCSPDTASSHPHSLGRQPRETGRPGCTMHTAHQCATQFAASVARQPGPRAAIIACTAGAQVGALRDP